MPRASLQEKAVRLIKDDNVMVINWDYFRILAKVQGDTGKYRVEIMRGMRFNCECNYFTHSDGMIECAHILAVKFMPIHDTWFNLVIDPETKELSYGGVDVDAIKPLIDIDSIE